MSALKLSEKNESILRARVNAFNQRLWSNPGPRVGDYCVLLDGSWRRFAHDWGEEMQVTPKDHLGSFYLGEGFADYSGSLDPSIPKTRFKLSTERRLGPFWFFDQGIPRAHSGVNVQVICNVYREVSA